MKIRPTDEHNIVDAKFRISHSFWNGGRTDKRFIALDDRIGKGRIQNGDPKIIFLCLVGLAIADMIDEKVAAVGELEGRRAPADPGIGKRRIPNRPHQHAAIGPHPENIICFGPMNAHGVGPLHRPVEHDELPADFPLKQHGILVVQRIEIGVDESVFLPVHKVPCRCEGQSDCIVGLAASVARVGKNVPVAHFRQAAVFHAEILVVKFRHQHRRAMPRQQTEIR